MVQNIIRRLIHIHEVAAVDHNVSSAQMFYGIFVRPQHYLCLMFVKMKQNDDTDCFCYC